MASEIESGSELKLDFSKLHNMSEQSVIPVVVQDIDSGRVLIVAYANAEALQHTLREGVATFWSTSRNELWVKGATSGDTLDVVETRVNCEQNSLLYLVRPRSVGACHTTLLNGKTRPSCFYRKITNNNQLQFVEGEQ